MSDAALHPDPVVPSDASRPLEAPPRWFGIGLLVLAAALVANTLVGPLVADALSYPFSDTVRNETLGLEAVSLLLVAPWCAAAGIVALRGRPLGAVLALGPTAYTVYMFVQYVAGPGYTTYEPNLLFHVAIFALAGALLLRAWSLSSPSVLPAMSRSAGRRWGAVLFAMALFTLSRWIEPLVSLVVDAGGSIDDAYLQDPGMYWSIFLLDLGIMVPALIATGVALWRGRTWASTGLYALVGWFALVPPSVTAMAIVKVLDDDPYADPADTIVLGVGALVFAGVAALLYRRLRGVRHPG